MSQPTRTTPLVFPEEPLPLPITHVSEAISCHHPGLHHLLPHLARWAESGVREVEVFQTSWNHTATIRQLKPSRLALNFEAA